VDRGMRIRQGEYRNQAGRLLFAMDEAAFWGAAGPSVCLRRGDLLDVLRASTAEVTRRWDTPSPPPSSWTTAFGSTWSRGRRRPTTSW